MLGVIALALFLWAGGHSPQGRAGMAPVPALKPQGLTVSSLPASGSAQGVQPAVQADQGQAPVPQPKPQLAARAPHAERPLRVFNRPLSQRDTNLYRDIFTLQAKGQMREADTLIAQIDNQKLLGHVLYQRYMHPTAYTSNFEELRSWLTRYADHAGADDIYSMAIKRVPSGYKGSLPKPAEAQSLYRARDPARYAGKPYRSPRERSETQKRQVQTYQKEIVSLIHQDRLSQALSRLSAEPMRSALDTVEQDKLRAHIASAYLYLGEVEKAYQLAADAVARSSQHVPLGGWVAGLVSWKRGQYDRAARYFELSASSPYASGWTAAAGSYWAARSHMRTGNVRVVSAWLKKAMVYPRSFYGLLATRSLGLDFDFKWDVPMFTNEYYRQLADIPAGDRAMALVAVGQQHLAEKELLRISNQDKSLHDVLVSYAEYAGLPALALRLGSAISDMTQVNYDAALYPVGAWLDPAELAVDPALLHAIIRQESKFDPDAHSPGGAVGLMQIIPSTASYVSGRDILAEKKGQYYLRDPKINLKIGQKYILELLKDKNVENDLLYLVIAYNAGPGNLARWRGQWPDVDDSLLFIELMRSAETRAYVEKVLSNYWIYRMRAGDPTPSLDAMAAGMPALYASIDTTQR